MGVERRDAKGRFVAGIRHSPRTEFQPGQHWRDEKPYWNRAWLEKEYIGNQRSAADIAAEFDVGDTTIHYWLRKHGIKTRTMAETRAIKHWGASGAQNPMYGKTGKSNPNWNGGHSPERQSLYARAAWKELAKAVLARDSYTCQQCGSLHQGGNKLQVHHIKPWSKYPELRFKESNLVTLCTTCHRKIHSKE